MVGAGTRLVLSRDMIFHVVVGAAVGCCDRALASRHEGYRATEIDVATHLLVSRYGLVSKG